MGRAAARVAPTQVASWRTGPDAHGPALCHQRDVLWQEDGVPMADAPDQYRQCAHHVWLLSSLAACGRLGTRHGHATPVGTAEPGTSSRALRLLCGSSEYQDSHT